MNLTLMNFMEMFFCLDLKRNRFAWRWLFA